MAIQLTTLQATTGGWHEQRTRALHPSQKQPGETSEEWAERLSMLVIDGVQQSERERQAQADIDHIGNTLRREMRQSYEKED